MGDILIICEHQDGEIKKYSKELASKSVEVAASMGCNVHALLFGEAADAKAASLGDFGVHKVTVAKGSGLNEFCADQYVAAASKLIEDIKPSLVLATASTIGKSITPRLAVLSDAGMASECVDLTINGPDMQFRRPIYAGKAWVDVKIKGDIKFATLRPNVFPIKKVDGVSSDVATLDVSPVESKVTLKERVEAEAKQVDLVEADVIVSGGRAIGNAENYKILDGLASVFNASIGASRAAVDAGYISHDHQVGQTGKTVNPTLYIACGISGAIQHLAGMRTSKYIVAINKDPEAPIFSKADFGVVGDLFKVVPLLTEKLKKIISS